MIFHEATKFACRVPLRSVSHSTSDKVLTYTILSILGGFLSIPFIIHMYT